MYMSYCRYEGTYSELQSCIYEAEEHIYEEAEYPVSDREIGYFKRMVMDFGTFLRDNELINSYGDIDREVLEEICEKMKKSYSYEE